MIRITITGERFPVGKQAIIAGDYNKEQVKAVIDDAFSKEQALEIDMIDGTLLYIPAVTLIHGVSDIQIEEVG